MKQSKLLLIMLCIAIFGGAAKGTVYFTEGTHTIDYIINDYVTIPGADTQITFAEGGWVKGMRLEYDGASFIMTGGYIKGQLTALSSSPMIIRGGIIGERLSIDSGFGGENGDVYIYGYDFSINGEAVPYGTYHYNGHLTGTLEYGNPIDVDMNCTGYNDLILIPEPATLLLLGLGALATRRKHK